MDANSLAQEGLHQGFHDDRRRHPRLPLRLNVHCKTFSNGEHAFTVLSFTDNLSAGGMALRTKQAYETGRDVMVTFFLPPSEIVAGRWGVQALPVIARTRVAWCRPQGESYHLGLEFVQLNSYSRRHFEAYLASYPAA